MSFIRCSSGVHVGLKYLIIIIIIQLLAHPFIEFSPPYNFCDVCLDFYRLEKFVETFTLHSNSQAFEFQGKDFITVVMRRKCRFRTRFVFVSGSESERLCFAENRAHSIFSDDNRGRNWNLS